MNENEWATEESALESLTIEELINRPPFKESRDDLGSATIGARIPEWMNRKITKFIEMAGSPYELKSDVARDALFLGIEILRLRYRYKWATESKVSTIVDTAGELDRLEQRFRDLTSSLEKLVSSGDTPKAASLLTEYVLAVSTEEDEWRKMRCVRQLRESRVVNDILKYCSDKIRSIIYG